MRKILILLLMSATFFVLSCEEDAEVLGVFGAQNCLNKADESNQSEVLACLDSINGYDSQKANSVRCSILLTAGGISATRVISAMSAQDSGGQTAMMTYFSFNTYSSDAERKTKAKEAKTACTKSGEKGLVGIAGFANTGTVLCKGATNCEATYTNDAQLDGLLTDCQSTSNGCSTDDKEEIADTALLMNDIYCTGGNASLPECQAFEAALDGVDTSDLSAVADAILGEWENPSN